ncbi:MAG: TetR/AcrR family transcriptional regulator [Lachnospiraceae bacterium]
MKVRLLEAAKQEFIQCGFAGAQVREIAKAAGATTGSLYKYYKDKEALFEALVGTPARQLEQQYAAIHHDFTRLPVGEQVDTLDETANHGLEWMVELMYDHFDAFKLIACCSAGTRYASFIDTLVEIEIDSSMIFIEKLQNAGHQVRQIDRGMVHMVANSMFYGVFETIVHDMPREKALEYTSCLRDFYAAGWFQILGI